MNPTVTLGLSLDKFVHSILDVKYVLSRNGHQAESRKLPYRGHNITQQPALCSDSKSHRVPAFQSSYFHIKSRLSAIRTLTGGFINCLPVLCK